MITPSFEEFLKLTKQGNTIPVCCDILADLETPVSAYMKLSAHNPYSCLLESVEGEERIARYSFVAAHPEFVFTSKGPQAQLIEFKDGREIKKAISLSGSPLDYLRDVMKNYRAVELEGIPRFWGGLVGYMGYDVVRFFEKLPQNTQDDLNLPDIVLMMVSELIVFDHRNHIIKLISVVHVKKNDTHAQKRLKYQAALDRLSQLRTTLKNPLPRLLSSSKQQKFLTKEASNLSSKQFEAMVKKAKEYIKAGDIIQVVLSQRFALPVKTHPLNIYRALRRINPSAYLYYLNLGDLQIIGSSPELLVRVENGVVETRPIAGTRRRGKDEREDARLAEELLNDPKERAEHIMLVDLGRNDLGRVCQQGSVKISELMIIEKYSHVMHIVSNVKGVLAKNKDAWDVLMAAFPAGTVSGAPKIRAMEIIDQLENVSRGPYAGAIGYYSLSGNLDICITIRTIVVKDKQAYTQAGAGIVADSNPKKEFQETVNKAKSQIAAIKLAHEILT